MLSFLPLPRLVFSSLLLAFVLQPQSTVAVLKYDEIQSKSSHNSYERREGLLDQMIYHHIRGVEIDCHLGTNAGEFRVYHDAGYFQSYSSMATLRDGVNLLLEFHNQFPNHHVVSVFVDLKGGLGTTHTAEDFDRHIDALPLFTPADTILNGEASIQAGVDANGWPEIEDMRGKFLWVLTSGASTYCSDNTSCNQRKAFISKSAKNQTDIGASSHIVFYNQNAEYSEFGPLVKQQGYISRVYDSNDIGEAEKWDKAIADQFHHITTDQVNFHEDTFSKTHNSNGFPFLSMNGLDVSNFDGDEGASILYMYANTGDTWGVVDDLNYIFSIDTAPANEWVEYTTTISLVNSHCERFAKAGIMLREEDDRYPVGSGHYFSVVRTCEEFVRVQYREQVYMYSVAKRLPSVSGDGIESAKRMALKVRYFFDGTDSTAEGYFRLEGTDEYVLIERRIFPNVKLTLHGLFTSSRYWDGNSDDTEFKALFVNTKRNNATLTASSFTETYGSNGDPVYGDGYFAPNDQSLTTGRQRRAQHYGGLRAFVENDA